MITVKIKLLQANLFLIKKNRDLIASNLIIDNQMDEFAYLNNLKLTCYFSRAVKLTINNNDLATNDQSKNEPKIIDIDEPYIQSINLRNKLNNNSY